MTHEVHQVIIQTISFLRFKRHRWYCPQCNELGRWQKSQTVATEQGWYHSDEVIFNELTQSGDASF